MANPTTKQELLASIADSYGKLCDQTDKLTDAEKNAQFSFAADPKKCGVRWQYDRCLRDLLIHLHEWQVLMREFVQNIREGHPRDYLPDEYRRTMAAYFVSVTTSPYGQAMKLLKTHQKNCKK